MTEKEFVDLIERYTSGKVTEQERSLLDAWYLKRAADPAETAHPQDLQAKMDRGLSKILASPQFYPPAVAKKKLWPRWIVAASVVIAVFAGGYFYYASRSATDTTELLASAIAPGKEGATLTLANGKKILINDALAGNIADESGVKITKNAAGQLVYVVEEQGTSDKAQGATAAYHTLSTTAGEQITVHLPDGSVVFLNAASSLRYPTTFAHLAKREVFLTGEGYFEVAKKGKEQGARIPFIVSTSTQQIEVLGTHFNVNAYADEGSTKTTLLEGRVKVSSGTSTLTLNPDQQALLTGNTLSLSTVNAAYAVAWKEGYFRFNDKTLEAGLREVARWYNVDVVYKNESLKKEPLAGRVSKYENITQVLKKMEKAGFFSFTIKGRQIIVE